MIVNVKTRVNEDIISVYMSLEQAADARATKGISS